MGGGAGPGTRFTTSRLLTAASRLLTAAFHTSRKKMAPMKAAKKPMTTIAKGNKRIPPGGTNKEVKLADKVTIPKLATKAYEGNPQDADGYGKASTPSRWQDPAFPCNICGPCKARWRRSRAPMAGGAGPGTRFTTSRLLTAASRLLAAAFHTSREQPC